MSEELVILDVMLTQDADRALDSLKRLRSTAMRLRARVAELREVVEAARPFAGLPIIGASIEGDRLKAALAKLDGGA